MQTSKVVASLWIVLAAGCSSQRGGHELLAPADMAQAIVSGPKQPVVDFAGLDLVPPSCAPCAVSGPGSFCGLDVGITPFVTGGVFGGFQSDPGTGASHTITITLSASIRWVTVKILDPDFVGNEMNTYDSMGNLVSTVAFPSDNMPGSFTGEFRDTGGQLIQKVELVPAPADYVAYDSLQVIPEGCDPPPVL